MNIEPIKEKCREKQMSIAELERKLDFSNGTIGKWKKGFPRADNLEKVADYFACTMDELLGRNST